MPKRLMFMIDVAGKDPAQASAEIMAAMKKYQGAEAAARMSVEPDEKEEGEKEEEDQLTPEERAALDAYLNRPKEEREASAKRFRKFVEGVVDELHKNPEESEDFRG